MQSRNTAACRRRASSLMGAGQGSPPRLSVEQGLRAGAGGSPARVVSPDRVRRQTERHDRRTADGGRLRDRGRRRGGTPVGGAVADHVRSDDAGCSARSVSLTDGTVSTSAVAAARSALALAGLVAPSGSVTGVDTGEHGPRPRGDRRPGARGRERRVRAGRRVCAAVPGPVRPRLRAAAALLPRRTSSGAAADGRRRQARGGRSPWRTCSPTPCGPSRRRPRWTTCAASTAPPSGRTVGTRPSVRGCRAVPSRRAHRRPRVERGQRPALRRGEGLPRRAGRLDRAPPRWTPVWPRPTELDGMKAAISAAAEDPGCTIYQAPHPRGVRDARLRPDAPSRGRARTRRTAAARARGADGSRRGRWRWSTP